MFDPCWKLSVCWLLSSRACECYFWRGYEWVDLGKSRASVLQEDEGRREGSKWRKSVGWLNDVWCLFERGGERKRVEAVGQEKTTRALLAGLSVRTHITKSSLLYPLWLAFLSFSLSLSQIKDDTLFKHFFIPSFLSFVPPSTFYNNLSKPSQQQRTWAPATEYSRTTTSGIAKGWQPSVMTGLWSRLVALLRNRPSLLCKLGSFSPVLLGYPNVF